ncbi:biotin/lipoyl-binding protein [Reinekea marina]|uniref:Efflux RND transporter periplasmic adaptor subunit n=1 Tax=Reinekea marina TaxID=1310421 RepID=A0ABV7WN79_9GAMM|nr:biotin/lipoyl-binding protein [Reinekea marina]MDN3648554.1 biotin/lipoyl-binding protein [Reinekea marina]
MTSRKKKFFYPIVVIAVGALIISWMVTKPKSSLEAKDSQAIDPLLNAPNVETIVATPDELAPQVVLYSQFKSAQQIELKAPISTDVISVNIQEGQRVLEGDRLIVLDTAALQRQLNQLAARKQEISARLALETKNHQANITALPIEQNLVDIAQRSVDRLFGLQNNNLASNADLENAERTLANQQLAIQNRQLAISRFTAIESQYQAQLTDIDSQLTQAQRNIENASIFAPFAGVVSSLQVQPADSVISGSVLLSLANEQQKQLVAWISAETLPAADELVSFTGIVETQFGAIDVQLQSIDPVSQAGSMRLIFQLVDSSNALTLNRYYRLWLNLPKVTSIAVPQSSVYSDQYVYAVEDNSLTRHSIKVVGERMIDGRLWRLVQGNIQEKNILVTRLQDAVNGLAVKPTLNAL